MKNEKINKKNEENRKENKDDNKDENKNKKMREWKRNCHWYSHCQWYITMRMKMYSLIVFVLTLYIFRLLISFSVPHCTASCCL